MPTLLLLELSGQIVRGGRGKEGKATGVGCLFSAEETLIVRGFRFVNGIRARASFLSRETCRRNLDFTCFIYV